MMWTQARMALGRLLQVVKSGPNWFKRVDHRAGKSGQRSECELARICTDIENHFGTKLEPLYIHKGIEITGEIASPVSVDAEAGKDFLHCSEGMHSQDPAWTTLMGEARTYSPRTTRQQPGLEHAVPPNAA